MATLLCTALRNALEADVVPPPGDLPGGKGAPL